MKAIASLSLLLLAGLLTSAQAEDTSADTVQIKRGEYLATAAGCTACHTAPGDKSFADGLSMQIPMLGTICSSDVTSDERAGIGKWTYGELEHAA